MQRTLSHTPLIICLFFWMFSLLLLRGIDDLDLFTQLRLGSHQLSTQSLLVTDPLTILRDGISVPNPGWLYQIVAAVIVNQTGLNILMIIQAAIFAVSFLVLLPRNNSFASPAIILGLLFAFLVAVPWSFMRPQVVAMLCFVLTERVLSKNQHSLKSGFSLLFIALIWANCHNSIAMGLALSIASLLSAPRSLSLLSVAIFSLAQFITPLGFETFALTQRNIELSRSVLAVTEWLPAWAPSVQLILMPFWFSVAVTIALFIRHYREISPKEYFGSVIFFGLAIYAVRFSLFYALFMAPIWIKLMSRENIIQRWQHTFSRKVLIGITYSFVTFCFLYLIFWRYEPIMEHRHVVTLLNQKQPRPRIFNYLPWGGMLEFWGDPQSKVVIDGRYYLFTEGEIKQYLKEAKGQVPLEEILNRYDPNVFYLNQEFQGDLITQLDSEPNWHVFYRDLKQVVYLRDEGINPP